MLEHHSNVLSPSSQIPSVQPTFLPRIFLRSRFGCHRHSGLWLDLGQELSPWDIGEDFFGSNWSDHDSSLVSLWQFEVSRELFCASAEGEEAGKIGAEFHGQCKPAIHINPLHRSHFSQALKTSRAGRAGARASRNLDQSLEFLALAYEGLYRFV